jgi:hypothetical protein
MACISADPAPVVDVKSAQDAAALPRETKCVRVVIPNRNDQTLLAAIFANAPNIKTLILYHPDNGVPVSIGVLLEFPKLKHLQITGDANLDDQAFAVVGKLKRLKSLKMRLP